MRDILRGILPVGLAVLFIGATLYGMLFYFMGVSYASILCAPIVLGKLLPRSWDWMALPLMAIDLALYAGAGIWLGLKLGNLLVRSGSKSEPQEK